MRFQFKRFLIPIISFAAGGMATALVIDFTAHADHAERMERIQRVKQAELTGAEDMLRVKRFVVSIDEVSNKFVFAEPFEGNYQKTLTMSDGSERTIRLTPMIHKNEQRIAFEDNGMTTYMGMNGTTTNGKLMVQINELSD